MTPFERKRCSEQLHGLSTASLKELAQMMELSNETEHEALDLILAELKTRGVNTDRLTLIERADAIPAEPD